MALIQLILLLLSSSNSTAPSKASNLTGLNELAHLKVRENEHNLTIPGSELSIVNHILNETKILNSIQELNESTDDLNLTQTYVKEVLNTAKTGEEFPEFTTTPTNEWETTEATEPSMNFSENYEQTNDVTTSAEEREGPPLRFDNMNSSQALDDYEMNESERESLISLIFNELKVNTSAHHKMTPDEKFARFFTKFGRLYNLVMKDLTPMIIEKILTANTTFQCMSALAKVYEALNNNQHWVFTSKLNFVIFRIIIRMKNILNTIILYEISFKTRMLKVLF